MGRHSAPNDEGDDARSAVQVETVRRPSPGRHARSDEGSSGDSAGGVDEANTRDTAAPDRASEPNPGEPRGLDLIEQALGDAPAEAADPDRASDETVQLPAVGARASDAPVPEAVTEQIPVVGGDPGPGSGAVPDVETAEADRPEPTAGADAPGPVAPPVERPVARRGGVSDLTLMRTNPALRARVIAAVIVPFVLYTVVLVVIGELRGRTFLIWIWIPLVSAGILAGLILDVAHRDGGKSGTRAAPPDTGGEPARADADDHPDDAVNE